MDYSGIVRVVKQQVGIAVRHLDPTDQVQTYLAEVPVRISRRPSETRFGFYRSAGAGDIGYVLMNATMCSTEERFAAVLYHELAHAVCSWVYGAGHHHGQAWRDIMVKLGQPPTRCLDI